MNQNKMLHVTKIVLLILIPSLLKSLIFVADSLGEPQYMNHSCQQNSYDSGSKFEANLHVILFTKFPQDANVFPFAVVPEGTDNDTVYGMFYCTGDVENTTCLACVEAAASKISDDCKSKEAIVWFKECTLRYTNRDIMFTYDITPYHRSYNTDTVTENHLDSFNIFNNTVETVISQASHKDEAEGKFANKTVIFSSSEMLKVIAQCARNINNSYCESCLEAAISLRDTWANTGIYLPSCRITYVLNATGVDVPPTPPPSPPPTTPPPSPIREHHIAIIVAIAVFLGLAAIGVYLRRRWSQDQNVKNGKYDDSGICGPRHEDDGRVDGLLKFSFSAVEEMTGNLAKKLGKGACGVVYYGRLRMTSEEVAVKMLYKSDELNQFNNEINLLKMIHHENVVSLLGYCEDKDKLALVCEFMNSGDLNDRLSTGPSLSWSERLQIAIDTATGLCYLHDGCDPPIVHRDVKPANILLHQTDEKLQAKVADFGYSKIFPENLTSVVTRVIFTPGYVAPEYLITGLLNKKADVYSFGVVLIHLITGQGPCSSDDVVDIFQNNLNIQNIRSVLDSRLSRDVSDESVWNAAEVAKACVCLDAAGRPEMSHIVTQLEQCLNMELQKIPASPSPASDIRVMSSIVLGTISEANSTYYTNVVSDTISTEQDAEVNR